MTLAHSENIEGGHRHYFSPRHFHFEHFSCMIFNYLPIAKMASVFAPLSFIKSVCVCVCLCYNATFYVQIAAWWQHAGEVSPQWFLF